MAAPLRVHRIPFSTNAERIALACGIKGVEVEWVDHDPSDRAASVALSGQELTPVAEFGNEVVSRLAPDPRAARARVPGAAPVSARRRRPGARADLHRVVQRGLEGPAQRPRRAYPNPHPAEGPLLRRIEGWTDRLDDLLSRAKYLFGDEVGIVDVIVYPFLQYAIDEPASRRRAALPRILHEVLEPGEHFGLDHWIGRMAAQPQA